MRPRPQSATVLVAALVVGAVAALAGPAPAAGLRPDVAIDAGRTLAVEGEPGGGEISLGLSLLWRLEDHFRFGVMTFADGLGQKRDRLIGAGGVDLGPVAGVFRTAQGAAVRLEAHLPGRHALEPHLAATWGFIRVKDDIRGALFQSDDAAGFGLGVGVLRPLNPHHAVGVALRAQQLSRGGARRYLSAGLEWRWSLGAGN